MAKRATVYFEEQIHKALRLKAAETDQSVSVLVNDAVRGALAEDADDLSAFRERAAENTIDFEEFVAERASTAVAKAWADDQRALDARGEFFFSCTQFCFAATRPTGPTRA